MQKYDTIIIGAGHNGLICASYLAKAGQNVLVLEAADQVGGLASTREFHPGFKASIAHSINQFSSKIVKDLNLTSHGYEPGEAVETIGLSVDGNHVHVKGDSLKGVSDSDASTYKTYRKKLLKFMKVLKPFSLKTIPRIAVGSMSDMLTFAKMGLRLRLMGKEDMRELMRVISLPTRDLMDENFDNDILKAVLSWEGLIGSRAAPRSPNNSVLMMLYRMSGDHGGDHAMPKGGVESLIDALKAAAIVNGVEIRTGAAVGNVIVEGSEDGLQATGVKLESGDVITAKIVVSAIDPKQTFIDLVGVNNLNIGFTNRINRIRSEGLVAKLHLALSDLPKFTGLADCGGRMIIAPEMDSIEFAFDNTKYGEVSENPVMEIVIPSLQNPSLAPDGQHVLSAHVMYVPNKLKGGWTDAARDALCARVIDTIAVYAPDIKDKILHSTLVTPADIAATHLVTGGHWHHGEFALDQMMMMRPTYEAAQYSTPIPGLYVASAGCHPGGGLMGGPGHNAAKEILS